MMRLTTLTTMLVLLGACGDPGGGGGNESEVITTVELSFQPAGGGAAIVAKVEDLDGDGGDPPTAQPIALAAGSYATTVRFANALEEPAEEITDEVRDESDQHQIFFTGSAVASGGPLQIAYADMDANGLPIGLATTVTAVAGSGELVVTLRHLPPINDTAVKTADLAERVRSGGFASIGGSSDADVTFPVANP